MDSAPTTTNTVAKNYQSSRLTGKIGDPQPVPQRSFFDDYPQAGIKQPDGTRLTLSIDGAPLSNSATIAGRNTVGGMDQGLSHESIRSNAEALGARFGQGTSRNLGKDLGRYNTGRGRDGEVYREILTRKGLTESELPHVIGHESGHLIDDLTFGRAIPSTGIRSQLEALYSAENSALNVAPGKIGATPEIYGYSGAKADAERMAEAIRVYMRDPNYLKSKFPEVAKRIRESVNTNPNLKDVIQFNSGAGAAGLLGYSESRD